MVGHQLSRQTIAILSQSKHFLRGLVIIFERLCWEHLVGLFPGIPKLAVVLHFLHLIAVTSIIPMSACVLHLRGVSPGKLNVAMTVLHLSHFLCLTLIVFGGVHFAQYRGLPFGFP